MNVHQGTFEHFSRNFAVVVSQFNSVVTQKLLEGALSGFSKCNCASSQIHVYKVPGTMEIPGTCAKILSGKKKFFGFLCLGCVIQGETNHHRHIASAVFPALQTLSIQHHVPIISGILTAKNPEQAIQRAGVKFVNQGYQSALTLLETANLYEQIEYQMSSNRKAHPPQTTQSHCDADLTESKPSINFSSS